MPKVTGTFTGMKLYEKLNFLRDRANVAQRDVAESIGRVQSRISMWERDVGSPTPEDLVGLARYYRVSLRYLCDDSVQLPDFFDWDSDADPSVNPEEAFMRTLSRKRQLAWEAMKRLTEEEAIHRLMNPCTSPTVQPGSPQTLTPLGGTVLTNAYPSPKAGTANKKRAGE
jgi:transcriptional regulator with XRE-family HTH domain